MTLYAGIDLHSNNIYLGVIDHDNQRLFSKRLPNKIDTIKNALQPFKNNLGGIAVESTYNWYWLVDGLQDDGYPVHLANPSATQQYKGIKHSDDKSDAFWLAQMLRLGILPEGYIYPKAERYTRDLLRRRLLYVRQRTTHILSFKSMATRSLGITISANAVKKLMPPDAQRLFEHEHLELLYCHHCLFAVSNRADPKAGLGVCEVKTTIRIVVNRPWHRQYFGHDHHVRSGQYRSFPKSRQLCLVLPLREK